MSPWGNLRLLDGVLMFPLVRIDEPSGLKSQLKVQEKTTTFLIYSRPASVHVNSGQLVR